MGAFTMRSVDPQAHSLGSSGLTEVTIFSILASIDRFRCHPNWKALKPPVQLPHFIGPTPSATVHYSRGTSYGPSK